MISDIERIKALIEIDLLDTEDERMFDDITQIASYVCDMPIALISILDSNRQFFKSNLGLNVRETPIEQSFCKIAVETSDEIFIVEDARLDERFKNNPLVNTYPKIVSYYGVPLHSKSGIAFGTLCVIDQNVKILNEKQKDNLIRLSKQIEYLIELRIGNKLLINYQTKVEQYSKDMEDFAYMAAHDLKAPVRAIHSFVSLLEKKYEDRWDDKDKKYLEFVNNSALKMNSLIHDLLEFSKSTSSTNNLESFDLKELILDLFSNLILTNNVQKPILICENMPTVFSSKIAFSTLFNNLISNALKYQKNQVAQIEIKSIDNVANWIFTFTDNGIGIETEYFDEIFKPFKRLHNNSEFQGNGLGLAACAKIIDYLKGTISVASVLGQGSVFTIKIPK